MIGEILSDPLFWYTLAVSTIVSFAVTTWMLRRERRPKPPRRPYPPFKESDHG